MSQRRAERHKLQNGEIGFIDSSGITNWHRNQQ